MLEPEPENHPDAALAAARTVAWLRFIDRVWAGDGCAHADVDLLRTCRTCGALVADEERA